MMEKAEQYDCDVVMCDCVKEFGDKSELYTHEIRSGYYSREQLEKEYFPHLLIMPNVEYPPTISNCLCLFKNKNIKLRYEEGIRFSEDLLFGAELMYQALSFYYMKDCCFYHILHMLLVPDYHSPILQHHIFLCQMRDLHQRHLLL